MKASNDISVPQLAFLVLLLFVIGLASLTLQRLRFPYTIGLVLVGLICSHLAGVWNLTGLTNVHLTENVILYFFLPPLIFDAALSLDVRTLRKNLTPILLLAAPGVVFATLFTGALVHWLTPLSWGPAMLFGALISTTDPVAVIATFKELKAPERLTMLVDGESLFNDATAIVIFTIIADLTAKGASPDGAVLFWAVLQFIGVFIGGFLVGCIVGRIGVFFIILGVKGHGALGVLFSIWAAYTAFIVAQGALGLSGVMAGVGAGVVIAHYSRQHGHSEVIQQMHEFWPLASFFGNSLIFLLLGMTEQYLLSANMLQNAGLYMLIATLIVLAARALLVYGFVPVSNALPGQEKIDLPYRAVMTWGGLRGALPVGLAISITATNLGMVNLAQAETERRLIVLFTVAVVVFTLVVQGMTIPRLMAKLGFVSRTD